jgi:hypothetical protein
MVTRAQENRIEQLAEAHGRVCVRHHYTDGDVRVTAENGHHYILRTYPEGSTGMAVMLDAGVDFSVRWKHI